MQNTNLEAAVYCQTSPREGLISEAPGSECFELERFCSTRGWGTRFFYFDEGTDPDEQFCQRSAAATLIKDAEEGTIHVVVCHDLFRLGSTMEAAKNAIQLFAEVGVHVITIYSQFDSLHRERDRELRLAWNRESRLRVSRAAVNIFN